MKIIFDLNYLQKNIQILEKALRSNNPSLFLANVHIKVTYKEIIFTSSNNSLLLQLTLEQKENQKIQIIEEGEVTINGINFSSYVKNLTSGPIEITFNNSESNMCEIKTKNSSYNLSSSHDHLEAVFEEDEKQIIIKKSLLTGIYSKTKHSVLKEESNPILTGINLSFQETISAFSTDSKRVSKLEYRNENNQVNKKITIPKSNFSDIEKILNLIEDEYISINITPKQVNFYGNEVKIKSTLLEGTFPIGQKTFEREFFYEADLRADILRESLLRIDSLVQKAVIILKSDGENLILHSEDPETGIIEEQCPFLSERGNSFKISFVAKYLIDALNSLGDGIVNMKFSSEVEPFEVKLREDETNKQLILPMRSNFD